VYAVLGKFNYEQLIKGVFSFWQSQTREGGIHPMAVKTLPELKVSDLMREYKSSFIDPWDGIDKAARDLKKKLIEEALEAERTELLLCQSYERTDTRTYYRHGYWTRHLLLKDGRLAIRMPRIRGCGYESAVVRRYQRRTDDVDASLLRIFLYGASTRLTGQALRPLVGEAVSAQTVSNIAKSLDGAVRSYHRRRLEDKYLYLFLDGIVLKTRSGFGAKKKAVLTAYGIRLDGKRELIDFLVTKHESEKNWEGFLNDLYRRGLTGDALGLVATDGNRGLENAVDTVYPHVKRQRCWAHKLRNVSDKLRKRDQEQCIKEARSMYSANNRTEAIHEYRSWAKKWRPIAPDAVKCLERDLEELLNFYSCPKAMWKKLRTTNVIERAFREVRRRTRPMTCFNNSQSIERIVYAVLNHLNSQWGIKPLKEFTQRA
jgi:transposase-like protein